MMDCQLLQHGERILHRNQTPDHAGRDGCGIFIHDGIRSSGFQSLLRILITIEILSPEGKKDCPGRYSAAVRTHLAATLQIQFV